MVPGTDKLSLLIVAIVGESAATDMLDTHRMAGLRQTAYGVDPVERRFRAASGGETVMTVPGSFYEFISRDRLPAIRRSTSPSIAAMRRVSSR